MPCVLTAVQRALAQAVPLICKSDQGSHFTSPQDGQLLLEARVQISMDGKGRAWENIYTERLWRSVKHEEVYLHEDTSPKEARSQLQKYFEFYNHKRIHQALQYQTPAEVYFQKQEEDSSWSKEFWTGNRRRVALKTASLSVLTSGSTLEQIDGIDLKSLERGLGDLLDMLWPTIHAHLLPLGTKFEPEFGGDHHVPAEGSKRFAYEFFVCERPYASAVSKKVMPRSTADRRSRIISCLSAGGP
jgi:hypothetical protein